MTQTELTSTASQTGKWKPYPAYKDSGVEWLGEIPEGWNTIPLKRATAFVSRGNSPEYVNESSIRVINQACVYWDGLRLENVKYYREENISDLKGLLRSGDLLINSTGTGTLGRAICFDQPGTFVADGHVTIVRVLVTKLQVRYLFYLIRSPLYHGYVYAALVSGSTNQVELSREGLRATPIILPSLPEQRAIVAFLDYETARINTLIAKKERLIELLQEKRGALISYAVTKGLDPTVPMKDSDVEWLGEIPAHWGAKLMKYVAKQETGHTPSRQHPEYWENCTIPWVSLADVWQLRNGLREYIEDTNEYISELGLANSSAQLLPAGTVIVSRTASVGFSGIMARSMATTQDFANWVCGPLIRSEYLLYVFRSMEQEFRRLVMGSTHQTIYMPDIRRFITPVPPRREQDAIVDHVRKETAKIDALISRVRDGIEKLREYRTAIISAAVTGKIDVRGEITPSDDTVL